MHLLCVGDIMLDRFEEGHVARISPEAPIPILQVTRQTVHAGGAGNVARNLASIGVPVTLVGLVGQDQAGSALKAELASMPAIKPALIADGQQATTCKNSLYRPWPTIIARRFRCPYPTYRGDGSSDFS